MRRASYLASPRIGINRQRLPSVGNGIILDAMAAPLDGAPQLPRLPAVEPEMLGRDGENRNLTGRSGDTGAWHGDARARQARWAAPSPDDSAIGDTLDSSEGRQR